MSSSLAYPGCGGATSPRPPRPRSGAWPARARWVTCPTSPFSRSTCPADAWLTLNSGARAQSRRPGRRLRRVPGRRPRGDLADVPGLPSLVSYNRQFHTSPAWGRWPAARPAPPPSAPAPRWPWPARPGTSPPTCGRRRTATAAVLSRCPLTVVDLETTSYPERALVPASIDAELTRIVADLPSAPPCSWSPPVRRPPPHLQLILVDGPGTGRACLSPARPASRAWWR